MERPLLLPLVPFYRLGVGLRALRFAAGLEPARELRWPVVSVGNLSAGGAGKTPMTIALARALGRCGLHVDVLSRGYGRSSAQVLRVETKGGAELYGDEPLVIARETGVPVYVARQRYEAGLLAEADAPVVAPGGAVHLLDDGFQHRQLKRTVDIVLLDRANWQDTLLPAGNLREPRSALRRASVLAIPAEESDLEAELRRWGWAGPVWHLKRTMQPPAVDGPVMAFCGIARPGQFFSGLERMHVNIAARRTFADHRAYREEDLRQLVDESRRSGVRAFVTTAKDVARLGALAAHFPADAPLLTAGLRTEIVDEERALDWLVERVTLQARS